LLDDEVEGVEEVLPDCVAEEESFDEVSDESEEVTETLDETSDVSGSVFGPLALSIAIKTAVNMSVKTITTDMMAPGVNVLFLLITSSNY
jgi:hypothetical protein